MVEDDEDITDWLSLEFVHEGYELVTVGDGHAGLEQALSAEWDMILLDVMRPGMSGLELCRRIRADSHIPIIMLTARDLEMNLNTREVLRGGEAISLTAREFALLQYLLEHQNQVMSRESFLQSVWGYDFMGDTNVVNVYIRYVRVKVDQGREPLVHTVRRVGYVLRDK